MDALPIALSLKRQAKKMKLGELLTLSFHQQARLSYQQYTQIIHLKIARLSRCWGKRCCLVNLNSNPVFTGFFVS